MADSKYDVLPEELMNSVLGNLYELLTTGDDVAPQSEDNYLAWISPGIPYAPEDLDFLTTGLVGVIKAKPTTDDNEEEPEEEANAEEDDEGSETSDEEEDDDDPGLSIEQKLAQDVAMKYKQAEDLARLCDMIPDTSGIKGEIVMNVWNPERTLSEAYQKALKFSQVANYEPDEKTKKKIKRLRGLLHETKTKKDLITEEEVEIQEETLLLKMYNEKMQKYLSTALEYNQHRINALAANNAAAVHFWSMNAPILRNRVTAAKDNWVTGGYRKEREQIAAYIDQVMGRSMLTLKQDYIDNLEKAKLAGLSSGSDFYYTSLLPGSFVRSDEGWTEFTFTESNFKSDYKFTNTKVSGSARYGLFGSVKGSHERKNMDIKIDRRHFKLTFKICQVPISRPWFNESFLTSTYWRFDQNNDIFKDDIISDGKRPPDGMIPAYPTTAIFVKDLELDFGKSNTEIRRAFRKTHASGRGGFGPFSAKLSVDTSKTTGGTTADSEGQSIKVEGMQLIGFKCHMLPKAPQPRKDVKEWV